MKKLGFIALFGICVLLMASCSADKRQPEATAAEKSWVSSDRSIHTAKTFLPAVPDGAKDDAVITRRIMIDEVPVIELYRADSRLAPVLFFLHDNESSKEQFVDEAAMYAQSGFLCVLFDMKGYGERASAEAVESIESAVQATADIDLLLEYYRLSPFADTDRFVIYGISMGGSAAWHYAAFGERTPTALIACSAAADYSALSDLGAVKNGKSQQPVWDEKRFMEYCISNNPIDHIEKLIQIPALVYQGMQDRTIPPETTQALERLLTSSGAQNNGFIYDDNGGHTVTIAFLNRILPFIKQYVKLSDSAL